MIMSLSVVFIGYCLDLICFLSAYGVGLFITFVMLFVMKKGQPALLYLVPCTLITGYVIGWIRGDLKKLWTGRMVYIPAFV